MTSMAHAEPDKVQIAQLWATAAAQLRNPDAAVEGADLLVGALLADPARDNEIRQFLDYFAFTGRDLLPDDYPSITTESLDRAASRVSPDPVGALSNAPASPILNIAQSLAGDRPPRMVHLLAGILREQSNITTALVEALSNSGVALTNLAQRYISEFLAGSPAQGEAAGEGLGAWLNDAFPRTPVNLPNFSSDSVDPRRDLIGISQEADAFAYLLASRDLKPPLAVGLFGNWGSGKSFLMTKIRTRIGQLSNLARQTGETGRTDLRVWHNIMPIEFNAWEYAETNLWAALLNRLFDKLSPEVRERLAEQQKAELVAKIKDVTSAADGLAKDVRKLEDAEAERRSELESARQIQRQLAESESIMMKELLTSAAAGSAREAVITGFSTQGDKLLGPGGTDLLNAVIDVRRAARQSRLLSSDYWTGRRVVAAVFAAIVVPFLAWLIGVLSSSPLVAVLGGVSALIPLGAAALKSLSQRLTEQEAELVKAEDEARAKVKDLHDGADNAANKAKSNLDKAQKSLAGPRAELAAQQQELRKLEGQHARLTPGTVFTDWSKARAESDDYRKHLTVVSTVRDDLRRLEELSHAYNDSIATSPPFNGAEQASDLASPPNRIILYIDDLDRCPPAKVVQVLEAVHLLLAFELFVVVVAVDTRWLTSALSDQLKALQGGEEHPTPNDYLEKIFQLPFWVDELDDHARERMLRGLLLPSVGGADELPAGPGDVLSVGPGEEAVVREMLTEYGSWLLVDTHPLTITDDELSTLQSMAPLVGGTPRRVKRFVNVCQFLLAMAPRLSDAPPQPTERMATCFMAAVHDGLPKVAAAIEHEGARTPELSLREILASTPEPDIDSERNVLDGWLEDHPQWNHALARQLLVRTDTIKRLRFDPPVPTGSR